MDESAKQSLPVWMDYALLNASCGIVLEQFRSKQVLHAYLMSGARGLSKATFAKVLTCALFCTSESKPCGRCEGCRQVLHGHSPDVLWLEPEGGKQMGVEKVREIIAAVSQHAFGAEYRVVIVEPVEKLTPQAQNCLLKSLEEPMANVVFLLLSHEMTAILGTIASRCARIKLTPWPDEVLVHTLIKLGYGETDIQRVLPMCSGNIGEAIAMLTDVQQDHDTQDWLAKALQISTDTDVVGISTSMKDNRESADRYLTAMEQAFHHALMVRTKQMDASALAAYPREWVQTATAAPVGDLLGLMRSIVEARRLKASQVNWQSTIDQLMMKILEERTKWRQLLA